MTEFQKFLKEYKEEIIFEDYIALDNYIENFGEIKYQEDYKKLYKEFDEDKTVKRYLVKLKSLEEMNQDGYHFHSPPDTISGPQGDSLHINIYDKFENKEFEVFYVKEKYTDCDELLYLFDSWMIDIIKEI
jgi:hypothetical protein